MADRIKFFPEVGEPDQRRVVWDFGDGSTSELEAPTHEYAEPGDYQVTRTVVSRYRTTVSVAPSSGPGDGGGGGGDGDPPDDGGDDGEGGDGDPPNPWVGAGVLATPEELASLPASGTAWQRLDAVARQPMNEIDLSDQDENDDVVALGKALYAARTADEALRVQVRTACLAAMESEMGGRTLALGRNLAPIVIAADLVGLPDAELERFSNWLRLVRVRELDGRTLVSTHEDRPNNWGCHAGASRLAVARFLGDADEIRRCATVFRGWLGDRSAYAGFRYGSDLSWQDDPQNPVGINPYAATKEGHSIDGVLPDDQRRGGSFSWPPPKENYAYEALQGVLLQAILLHRSGYDPWGWSDSAILRAFRWLHDEVEFPAVGDDTWQPWVVNNFYGTALPTSPAGTGKGFGYTDWLFGGAGGATG